MDTIENYSVNVTLWAELIYQRFINYQKAYNEPTVGLQLPQSRGVLQSLTLTSWGRQTQKLLHRNATKIAK